MKQYLFYFNKPTVWDKWTVCLYAVVTLTIYLIYRSNEYTVENRLLIFSYTFGTHLFLYFFNYKSLRNMSIFLIWTLFGILHFIGYLLLADDQSLQMNSVLGLRNTLILLILFQLLRLLSVNIQHQEFVAVAKGSKTDLFEERRITAIDFLVFVIYVGAMIVLNVL